MRFTSGRPFEEAYLYFILTPCCFNIIVIFYSFMVYQTAKSRTFNEFKTQLDLTIGLQSFVTLIFCCLTVLVTSETAHCIQDLTFV